MIAPLARQARLTRDEEPEEYAAGAPPVDLDALDPGVRKLVAWLRARDYQTTDSGDGVSKADLIATGDALDVPHVHMVCARCMLLATARNLCDDLKRVGVRVEPGTIQATFDPADGSAILSLYGVTDADLDPAGGAS